MGSIALRSILDGVFRFSPAYGVKLFDRLPADQQDLLKELTQDPDFYGVLLPSVPGARAIKSVCRDTALLLHTLREPGPLPRYLNEVLGDTTNQTIAELVLDGVLEMEHQGRFVSGSEAYSLIYWSEAAGAPQGVLARLSQEALEYAQLLAIDDIPRLSARLYFYNRIPVTARWSRRLSSEEEVSSFIGISEPSNQKRLQRGWKGMKGSMPYTGWFQWQSRRVKAEHRGRRHGYKLYVSPVPEAAPDAFRAALEVLEEAPAHYFKIGCDASGLLRPDKLVLYFSDYEPLEKAARDIAGLLRGCVAQGVPFTAAITEDGLLSWGADPPAEKTTLSWQEKESWRLWITNRLAVALVSARENCPASLQPWQFALERLRLERVDTTNWAPTEGFALPA
jgi:hypothetical protein